ncbi:hypothetical protein [Eudoraea sp.]|uniref:hypothetical protein n=1 Tax=Eudoraea sp. TaxID=1979955 RepID=UPI003C759F9B
MKADQIKQIRTITGAIVLIGGFLSPLLIPTVLDSDLSVSMKSIVSGLLAFGIPELFMLVAVAIMRKSGYLYLKEKAMKFITVISPQQVSKIRYKIGVVLFVIPIALGVLQPYLAHYIPFFEDIPMLWVIISDLMLLISLFILGGEFWEKLKGLFLYDIIAIKRPVNKA